MRVHPLPATLLTLGLILALAAPVQAAVHLDGPRTVAPYHRVTVRIAGMRPHEHILSVFLQPTRNRGGNGIGAVVYRPRRADRHGGMRVRFRWPPYYLVCGGFGDCHRRRWRPGQRVDITLYSHPHARHVVRVRRRHRQRMWI